MVAYVHAEKSLTTLSAVMVEQGYAATILRTFAVAGRATSNTLTTQTPTGSRSLSARPSLKKRLLDPDLLQELQLLSQELYSLFLATVFSNLT